MERFQRHHRPQTAERRIRTSRALNQAGPNRARITCIFKNARHESRSPKRVMSWKACEHGETRSKTPQCERMRCEWACRSVVGKIQVEWFTIACGQPIYRTAGWWRSSSQRGMDWSRHRPSHKRQITNHWLHLRPDSIILQYAMIRTCSCHCIWSTLLCTRLLQSLKSTLS